MSEQDYLSKAKRELKATERYVEGLMETIDKIDEAVETEPCDEHEELLIDKLWATGELVLNSSKLEDLRELVEKLEKEPV